MELKRDKAFIEITDFLLLIELYGIETKQTLMRLKDIKRLLIELYGIETSVSFVNSPFIFTF